MDKPILKRGFTLLELLIVIAIVGILVSIGVVSYSSAQKKSRDSRRSQDLKAIQAAWEQYYADNNAAYPSSCSIATTYLPAGPPTDPKTAGSYTTTPGCTASSYCFCALLEGSTGNADGSCDYAAVSKTYYCVSNLQ